MELAMRPGNDLCADCKTRNPRWASHNLGIFVCMNCASVHRKIGTHITKVKSLTMDVWTREQVEHMRQVGNIKSNEMYNRDEVRHPPPANMIDVARDSEIEKFIRDKYEFKRFVSRTDRAAVVASHLGPSRSVSSARSSTSSSSFPPSPTRNRTHTLPPPKPSIPPATSAPVAPTRTETVPPSTSANTTMSHSVSQPVSQPAQTPAGGVWSDLASLQGPTRTSTLPLQYLSSTSPPSAPVPATNLTSNPTAGSTTLGPNFVMTPASHGPSSGPSVYPADALVSGVATQPMQPPFALGTGVVNPFAQMAAQQQQQAQAQQNHPPLASAFGSSIPQQPFFTPQIQQPVFSRSVTNPFNAAVPPQPQAPFLSMTPSPVPFTSSPYQQPAQVPFQQQPTETSFQPQPPQFGNGQPSGASVAGNPFTSWVTQQPNGYASAHVGHGSVNGPWGSM